MLNVVRKMFANLLTASFLSFSDFDFGLNEFYEEEWLGGGIVGVVGVSAAEGYINGPSIKHADDVDVDVGR